MHRSAAAAPISLIATTAAWQQVSEEIRSCVESCAVLRNEGSAALEAPLLSVTRKNHSVPSGDPHDYVSQGPYWWPDPDQPDGLPYVRRDGETNPEFHTFDYPRLEKMVRLVRWLVLAALALDSEHHAHRAGKLLQTWFLDPTTRMNPHLQFGQRIPGRCDGRGIGIIDTSICCWLLDAVAQLPHTDSWREVEETELRAWFRRYLDWLLNSAHGREECAERNNHGTWYDAQVAVFGVFCGERQTVRDHLERHMPERIESQIEPDGSQPHELKRTLSMHYTSYNLTAMAVAAQAGMNAGVDLWSYKGADGRGIVRGVEWFLPYLNGDREWRWTQLKPFPAVFAAPLCHFAALAAKRKDFHAAAQSAADHPWSKITILK